MKQICPSCGEVAIRGSRQCSECDWRFAFQSSKVTTDLEWFELIEELSDQSRLFFTTNQLFIHWQRPRVLKLDSTTARMYLAILILLASSQLPVSINLISVLTLSLLVYVPVIGRFLALLLNVRWFGRLIKLIVLVVVTSAYFWFVLNLAAMIPILLFSASLIEYQWRRAHLGKQSFMQQLQRWQRYHKVPELLIKPNMYHPQTDLLGDGLYDYGVKDILIVDQDLTVDLLVKNGFLKDIFILHRDGRDYKETTKQLRDLGIKKHRILHLGWGVKSRKFLIDHLGFTPKEWDAFAIDSLPPESLLEGLPVALEEEIPLVEILGSRLRLLT